MSKEKQSDELPFDRCLEMAASHFDTRVQFFKRLVTLSKFPECREALKKDGYEPQNWMRSEDELYKTLNKGGAATRDYMILHDDQGITIWESKSE